MSLLIIIYLAFISLGLPDALLGSSWTVMHLEFGVSIEFAGAIAMIISGGTILSSLYSSRIIRRFGTGKVVAVSVTMTAIALIGFSVSSAIWMLMLCAVPLGLGAGAVDAALNNFVALHYKPRHMNWLHCFWGVGASGGPLILGLIIARNGTWRNGYTIVGIIQFALVIVLFVTLPMWKRFTTEMSKEDHDDTAFISNRKAFKIKGVKLVLVTFLFYCSLEAGTGLWAASYLTTQRGVSPANAALWTSMYYGGITAGRFLSGIMAEKIKGETLIRGGLMMIFGGVVLLILPLPLILSMSGLLLIGLGCAPIYPSMIHLTPDRFGKGASQSIIGLSMAFAYIGSTFMPPLLGAVASVLSLKILPYALLIFAVGMIISSERLRKTIVLPQ
ncbi:MAG: MFS transporter [Vallitaleaceae bacterium]|nr:MFS transporter [Vallitaleaceae bacterium]